MSKYNFYKAIKVAGRLAERAEQNALSGSLDADAVDVILDLVKRIQEYEANDLAKKTPSVSSLSIGINDNTLPCRNDVSGFSYGTATLGYPPKA